MRQARVSYIIVLFKNMGLTLNPNLYGIPVGMPFDDVTGVKWLQLSNIVYHWREGSNVYRVIICQPSLGRAFAFQ